MLPSSSSFRGTDDAVASFATTTAPVVPSVASAFTPTGVETLSVSELRAGMQQFLRSSGALSSLKTQLRSVIVTELLRHQGTAAKAEALQHRPNGVHEGKRKTDEGEEEDDRWTQRLADALVENHLRQTGRSFSLAIFSSEADVSFGSTGDNALEGLLHINSCVTSVMSRRGTSLLQSVVEAHLRHVSDARGQTSGYAVGTQTDVCDTDLSPPSLEVRLAAVDAKYALCFARLGESTREEVDRRMAAYRQDLQLQMEQEYQQRLRAFEQQRLLETRREAEDHYGVLLRHKMEELREVERASVQRIEAERARLAQARDDVELQRAELERRHRDLQGLLEERDKATAAMEGRLNDAKQQIRVLTTQVRQFEELCGVRLAEADAARDREWRRMEDLRRLQAEHVAELQLKDEEIYRLRFRLKSIIAAHGVAGWRGETEEEKTITIQDAITRTNAFQQRVLAAQNPPPLQQPREAAWHSAWESTALSRSTTATAVDRRNEVTEQQVKHQPVVPVTHSAEPKIRVDEEVMNVGAPSASPYQVFTDSPPAHKFPVVKLISSQALEETWAGGEGGLESSGERGHGSKKEEVGQREKSSCVASTSASSSKSHSKRSDGFGTRDNDDMSQSSSSSSSSSLLPSSVRSPNSRSVSVGKQAEDNTTVPLPTTLSALSEKQNLLYCEEASGRAAVEADENAARQGILWTAKSQHTVLLQRQAAEQDEFRADAQRGTSSFDVYMAQARQWQPAPENIRITRDSDDEGDSDILFGQRGSSDESF